MLLMMMTMMIVRRGLYSDPVKLAMRMLSPLSIVQTTLRNKRGTHTHTHTSTHKYITYTYKQHIQILVNLNVVELFKGGSERVDLYINFDIKTIQDTIAFVFKFFCTNIMEFSLQIVVCCKRKSF